MSVPTPLLDFLKRGEVARDVRMLAAEGALAPRAAEQLSILVYLLEDRDPDVRHAAGNTLDRIPLQALEAFLARPDAPLELRDFFARRGVLPSAAAAEDIDSPLVDSEPESMSQEPEDPPTVAQRLAKMGFSERLKAAMKGTREVRTLLIRDPNKVIAVSVLSSPKVSEPEIEVYARMANVSEDVLRTIASSRTWMKNYGIVASLTKNPKTPVATSLNLLSRLNARDLQLLSIDRNIPEPLRVAARRRVAAGADKK